MQAFAAHGIHDALDEGEYLALGGVPGPGIVAHVGSRLGRPIDPEPILKLKRALVMEMVHAMTPIEPVVSWLHWCHEAGIGVAVGSGGTRRIVLACLESTGLMRYFDPAHVFTADDVAAGKPAPDIFLAAASALGVAPADCLVVEDGPPGIAAAAAAGMRCLDVREYI